jgi:hypothetical protein
MFTHALILALSMTTGLGSQRGAPPKAFAYDPVQLEAYYRAQHIDTTSPLGANTEQSSANKPGQGPNGAPSYVNISGNFGGVFTVAGVGTQTSQNEVNVVNIITNRALTFTANSFKPLMLGNTSEGAMGTVTYSMALFQGTAAHPGALVAGPVSGTDGRFNGQMLGFNSHQIPANGSMILVLTRTLTMTQKANGACTLIGTGYIGVTIN